MALVSINDCQIGVLMGEDGKKTLQFSHFSDATVECFYREKVLDIVNLFAGPIKVII